MKRAVALAAFAMIGLGACLGGTDVEAAGPLGLLGQIKQALSCNNPRIARVHLLALIADSSRPGHRYAALATGTTPSPVEVSDERFGVFVVDSTLTRVEEVVETFPSGRLGDYTVLISFPTPDSLLVRASGNMDSGVPLRHAHAWHP